MLALQGKMKKGLCMRVIHSFSIRFMLAVCVASPVWGQASKPASPSTCLVASFKALALGEHDVERRASKAEEWLRSNSAGCTMEQISAIVGNSSSWLGHALTPRLSGLVEGLLEIKIAGNPALMGKLYESLGKEGKASVEIAQTPLPLPPVVPPNTMPMPPVWVAPQISLKP